ncbi:3948_t:CDS:2, partial [Cetraspora pellucida]
MSIELRLANRRKRLEKKNEDIAKLAKETEELEKKDEAERAKREAEDKRTLSPTRRGRKDNADLNFQPNLEISRKKKKLQDLIEGTEKKEGQKECKARMEKLENEAAESEKLLQEVEECKNDIEKFNSAEYRKNLLDKLNE